jgi:hypothetical protein
MLAMLSRLTDIHQRKTEAGVVDILFRRRRTLAVKSRLDAQVLTFPERFSQIYVHTLEAVWAFAQTNQRVLGKFIELSSSAAKETLRACAEFQSAAIEATETATVATWGSWEKLGEPLSRLFR